ncbi:uncharacterized protein TRIADDRAFT_26100, partial [Trichoplax adhaerens]
GADIEARDNRGQTPLLLAVINGYTPVIKKLLELGADIATTDSNGRHCMHYLAEKSDVSNILALYENGTSLDTVDEEGNTLLHIAAKGNHRDTVKLILQATKAKDINIRNAFGQKPIHIAAKYGHNRVVHNMIRNGADINSK